ncbi:hypothetical protein DFH27DRAFT_308134 [Peziza echinospora]|nr:hypothetical protein DFH27DRAFT_308134 [Peziza echinospora]
MAPTASDFECKINTLSKLDLFLQAPRARNGGGKYLQLLDGIALILVRSIGDEDADEDAAAVSFERLSNGIKLWYTKNEPCTDEEKTYLNGLIQVCKGNSRKDASPSFDLLGDLLIGRIIPFCIMRIHRLFKDLYFYHILSPEGLHRPRSPQSLREWQRVGNNEEENNTYELALDNLLAYANETTHSSLDRLKTRDEMKSIAIFLGVASFLYEASNRGTKAFEVKDKDVLSTMRHIGNYFRIARLLRDMVLYHKRTGDIDWLASDLTTEEVPLSSDKTQDVQVPKGTLLDLVNKSVDEAGLKESVSLEDIDELFGSPIYSQILPTTPTEESNEPETHPRRAHCVSTLAQHMLKSRAQRSSLQNGSPILIGTSSGKCCWMCEKYMNFLSQNSKIIPRGVKQLYVVSQRERKFPPMWAFPSRTPSTVVEWLMEKVDSVLGEVGKHLTLYHQGKAVRKFLCDQPDQKEKEKPLVRVERSDASRLEDLEQIFDDAEVGHDDFDE